MPFSGALRSWVLGGPSEAIVVTRRATSFALGAFMARLVYVILILYSRKYL